MPVLTIYHWLLIVFGSVYFILIMLYSRGWFSLKPFKSNNDIRPDLKASVIIPARNEAANITFLLEDLAVQNLPSKHMEVIVVDDNSTDNTADKVRQFMAKNPELNMRLITMPEQSQTRTFKKLAISTAIGESEGELIITTDADCRVGKAWLTNILCYYTANQPKMIIGPVSFHHEKSVFEKMQSLEFLSLIAITGGAISIGKPVMCNGANLAYEKKAFYETGGFDQDSFASGDDVFLLLKMLKKFGGSSIHFLKSFDAVVYTEAQKTIREFYHQRTRWASKNKGYDLRILFVSFTVYMVNMLLVAGGIATLFYDRLLGFFLWAVFIKILIDMPILIGITTFVKRNKMFLYTIPLIIFYPLYIVLIGALGMMGNYQWKGRKVTR